ncbi:SDR family oxidoreductase [Corynebacterium frankenforstense]|uniref:SDR family oxidoreductase n=1 Tax=Corynebacterium frankenforstense TaxID=1230998 RepID=UPI0009FAE4B9|nr:SDR family oxidoreductase [Corynebacterium frankenforstense]
MANLLRRLRSSAPLATFLPADLPPVRPGETALVTGATSGIGRAVAVALRDAGFRVLGTSRTPHTADAPEGVELLPLDLADPASIALLPGELRSRGLSGSADGGVTVLVNNAGESQNGPVEELPRSALERVFQINTIGQIEVTQKVLTGMRNSRRGRVIFIGSMLGSFPLAYRGSYGASKAAVRQFAFAARRELRGFGIGVSVVEPGAIATGLSARRTVYVDPDGPYAGEFTTMLRRLNRNESRGISAERVAAEIMKPVTAARPAPLYAVGSQAPLAFAAARLLPRDAMAGILARRHGLR